MSSFPNIMRAAGELLRFVVVLLAIGAVLILANDLAGVMFPGTVG